jgi:hypothetical protein
LIVVPLWLAAPIAGGFAARRLGLGERRLAAGAAGTLIAVFAAILFSQAAAFPDCQFGTRQDVAILAIPSIVIGAMVGAGFALSALLVGLFVLEQRPWRGIAVGGAVGIAALFVEVALVSAVLLGSGGCQRPIL